MPGSFCAQTKYRTPRCSNVVASKEKLSQRVAIGPFSVQTPSIGFGDAFSNTYIWWSKIGYWTSPGDFGDTRGTFNPEWWPPHLNQYGMLKLIRINHEGSYIDGCRISDVSLADIKLDYRSDINFRIAVTDKPVNKRGLTIFGKNFGNYSQDLLVRVLYSVADEE